MIPITRRHLDFSIKSQIEDKLDELKERIKKGLQQIPEDCIMHNSEWYYKASRIFELIENLKTSHNNDFKAHKSSPKLCPECGKEMWQKEGVWICNCQIDKELEAEDKAS